MSSYKPVKEIKVGLQFASDTIPIGRLAIRDNRVYFEYDQSFLALDLHISPFKLPLQTGLQSFDPFLFEGLHGVFDDSLPDGWGRLLVDRFLKSQGILPAEFSPLDRLALVGATGLGALVYAPDHSSQASDSPLDLNKLANQTRDVLHGEASEVLKELIDLGGSSAGARPKVVVGLDGEKKNIIHGKHQLPDGYEHWMVKFPNVNDGDDAGAIEYVYSQMARQAGLIMPATYLFPADKGPGYFAVKRFDCSPGRRWHMHTASGLLHANFRVPALDYENLLELTLALTKDAREVEKMFRLAVFNVLAHNRDDHGKNFSYLMDQTGDWTLAPAYDLTFSSGPGGQQSTMVMGEGQAPSMAHLIQLGKQTHLSSTDLTAIIDQTAEALSHWEELARTFGVKENNIKLIKARMVV
ncbi:type II toxin-antitoxin system HipA family toxin [Imperialibacter roseus]|uniref:Type II toxin-antitoxin system HipA family toxin n=1 Tax=Imperialibacter roseus TaxID=1324217 RepID=A0ABZ0ITP5_9BACT|nr:type II toxin-antitoxin system HipA family toxin [Imperialibacter roseus]WOK08402.1 type II toxin-antitoxin system HipA family toxin [Imperialibacter roseus]